MAEYGEKATKLSDPQAQGANVVSPVQPNTDLPLFVKEIGSIFVQGLNNKRANDLEDAKNAAALRKKIAVDGFVKRENEINDAFASGQISPSEAAIRSKANFSQNAGSYSEYISDFNNAKQALRGNTETGDIEEKIKLDKDIRKADIEDARKSGFVFLQGMSPKAENDQIDAHKTRLRADQEVERMHKKNAEERAAGSYNAEVAAREGKEASFKLVNDIAGSNLQAFQSFSVSLSENVKSGKMSFDEAQATLNERYSNISASIQAAARINPELAAPFRSLFDQMNDISKKMIDPKQQSDALAEQLNLIKNRLKLVAMSNPKDAALIVTNELLPNNLALQSSVQSVNLLNRLSNTPITDKGTFVPNVVGNPEAEPEILNILKGALSDLKSDKITNKEIASVQAGNSLNQILKQTGELVDKGATPQQLKGLAQFFASPEYATFVTSGKIDKAAAGTAKKTFQLIYEPAIKNGIQEKFKEFLPGQAAFGQKQGEPVELGQTIDVVFSGSGVVFKAKPAARLDPVERRSQEESVKALTSTQTAINQLIHIGAHLEGTTDYAKYWNENKHVWMPQIFPEPTKLKVGDIIDGYKYIKEGSYNDPRNWQPVE